MKICFFNDIATLGGGEHWVLRTCDYLRKHHHDVSVICPQSSALAEACHRRQINTFTYPAAHPPTESLYGFLLQTKPEILYCTVIGYCCEVRLLEQLVNRLRLDSVGSDISIILKTGLPPKEDLSPEYYGAGAGGAIRRLHVVSSSIKKAFLHWQPQMDNGFIEVCYEGVDREIFCKNRYDTTACREHFGIGPEQLVITCIARLTGIKGQGVLLRAVPGVVNTHPHAHFLFAGEGPDRDLLEIMCEDLGISSRVRFLGEINNIPQLLSATDILCHPSLNEGIPNVLIEAMTMGVPIVATELPGILEVVEHRKTGILVRPNDFQQLGNALCDSIADVNGRARMARDAARTVEDSFDFRTHSDRLIANLSAELRARRKAPHSRNAPRDLQRHGTIAVLFIMHEIRLGGEETELGILPRYLNRKRFNLSVLTCYPSIEEAPVLDRLRYYDVPVDNGCVCLPEEEEKISYIAEYIRSRDIGIVVACQDTSLVYEVFKRLSPSECRLIEHGGVLRDVFRIPKNFTARYIGVSKEITNTAALLMRTPLHAVYIPSMVDLDEYDDQEWAEARGLIKDWLHATLLKPFGYDENACVIVFVGRLDPRKRPENLIMAARYLEADCPEAFFLIIGGIDSYEPDYGHRLISGAADLMARGRLAFTGTRSDIAGILKCSDILVLPGTGEGMAHVINEAGAAGIAVIATEDGAAPEQLENGRCGMLIPPQNPEKLVEVLKCLIKDKSLRCELGQKLKNSVDRKFDARVVISQWHTLFESVAAELKKPVRIPPSLFADQNN